MVSWNVCLRDLRLCLNMIIEVLLCFCRTQNFVSQAISYVMTTGGL
jgi:hypothetical protein